MNQKYRIIPAVFVMLKKDDKIFCIRRYNTGYSDGLYTLPSGHIEDGETLVEAAIREVKEETGVDILERDLKPVHTMYRYSSDEPYIDFYFEVATWTGEPTNAEPQKCDHADWFSVDNLPKNMLPYVPHMITCVHEGTTFSEYPCEGI